MKHNSGLPVRHKRCGRFRPCMFDDDRRCFFRGVLKAGAIDKQRSEGNAGALSWAALQLASQAWQAMQRS